MIFYVYCITTKEHEDKNEYKIGYSKSMPKRKNDFDHDTINLHDWYYIDAITVEGEKNARELEQMLHSFFSEERISDKREFFKIDNKDKIFSIFSKIKNSNKKNQKSGIVNRRGESISNLIKTKEIFANNLTKIFLEKIHNAYAANAKNMWIKVGPDGKSITYKDDGCGFTYDQLLNYATHDKFHCNDKGASVHGIGGKDADRAMADFENSETGFSTVEYLTSTDGISLSKLVWRIGKSLKLYENPEVYPNQPYTGGNCHKGTIIKQDETILITGENLAKTRNELRFFCSTLDMNIYVSKSVGGNGYELISDYFNPFYFEKLNGIKTNGIVPHGDGSVHKILHKELINESNPEKCLKIKIIGFYMSSEFSKIKEHLDEPSVEWSGLYFMYNNTFLNKPILINKGLRHAYNRTRILVIFENLETAINFGIRSAKTEKIKFEDNYNLKNFVDENGDDFVSIIRQESCFWDYFDQKQRSYRNSEKLNYVDSIIKASENIKDYEIIKPDVTSLEGIDVGLLEENNKKNKYEVHKEREEEINNAIKEYELLSSNEKTLLKKYQNCVSYGAFAPKKGSIKKKYSLLKDFDNEIEIYPWSIHNNVTSGKGEIERMYEYFKNVRKKSCSSITSLLNDYLISCYEVKAEKENCVFTPTVYA